MECHVKFCDNQETCGQVAPYLTPAAALTSFPAALYVSSPSYTCLRRTLASQLPLIPCNYQWLVSIFRYTGPGLSLRGYTLGRPRAEYGLHSIDFCGEKLPELGVSGEAGVSSQYVAKLSTVLCTEYPTSFDFSVMCSDHVELYVGDQRVLARGDSGECGLITETLQLDDGCH